MQRKTLFMACLCIVLILALSVFCWGFLRLYRTAEISVFLEAAQSGDKVAIQRMLDGGIDPNASYGSGKSALRAAEKYGHKDVVDLLKRAGATH